MGRLFLENLKKIFDVSSRNGSHVIEVRGKGLFLAVEFHNDTLANSLSKKLLENGVIAKPTNKHTLKMTPPLVLTEKQINEISQIF